MIAAMTGQACPACGETDFEEGFIDDAVSGKVRWFSGRMRLGMFGAKRVGLPRRTVRALRCVACSRLELYADVDD
jgi:hypothetical protein